MAALEAMHAGHDSNSVAHSQQVSREVSPAPAPSHTPHGSAATTVTFADSATTPSTPPAMAPQVLADA